MSSFEGIYSTRRLGSCDQIALSLEFYRLDNFVFQVEIITYEKSFEVLCIDDS